ncbi:hypothetical protein SAMN05192561_1011088 [Halopenitus malekzadehii]|uniref:Uncharacterized protein n=1 Tax=Halopenitus malekzadehii TaxID=1267564 RepID=A0A1H6I5C6_9EURY|nr:hypothetical protein [Halopenitus malekzadehii]SEH43874.1 hypothetical protein SAMN05192561_1011088 [Halopenitus malekzadehii]
MISFEASDRLVAAAEEWGEARLEERDEAIETKVEQALLEVEHLVSGAHEVDFEVDGRTVHLEPTDALATFLERQATAKGLDESDVLALHVDLFARVFLDDEERPSNAPPT